MPFVLIAIGLMLTVVAVRDNQDAFFAQVQKDFTGKDNFGIWIIAIVAIGSLGYVKALKTPIDLLLGLMLIGFLFSNKSGFTNALSTLQQAFTNLGASVTSSASPSAPVSAPAATQGSITSAPAGTAQSILNEVTGSDSSLVQSLFGGNN